MSRRGPYQKNSARVTKTTRIEKAVQIAKVRRMFMGSLLVFGEKEGVENGKDEGNENDF